MVLYGYGVFVFFTSANYAAVQIKVYGSGGREQPLNVGSFAQVPKMVCIRYSLHVGQRSTPSDPAHGPQFAIRLAKIRLRLLVGALQGKEVMTSARATSLNDTLILPTGWQSLHCRSPVRNCGHQTAEAERISTRQLWTRARTSLPGICMCLL